MNKESNAGYAMGSLNHTHNSVCVCVDHKSTSDITTVAYEDDIATDTLTLTAQRACTHTYVMKQPGGNRIWGGGGGEKKREEGRRGIWHMLPAGRGSISSHNQPPSTTRHTHYTNITD